MPSKFLHVRRRVAAVRSQRYESMYRKLDRGMDSLLEVVIMDPGVKRISKLLTGFLEIRAI